MRMFDIFERIRQKCPDGVPHVRIGDVAVVSAGYGFPKKYQGCTNGFPFYKVDDMNNAENGFMMRAAENYVTDDVLSKIGGKICRSGTIIFPKIGAAVGTDKKRMLMEDAVFDNNVMGIMADMQQLDDKFLLYWLSTIPLMSFVIGDGAIPSIRKTAVEDRLIPVPPLQIQREIVALLDKFDAYCNGMTSGLSGELEMRRKQYRYWLDKIFQDLLNEGCRMKAIGMLGKFDRASGIKKDELLSEGMPCLHYGQVYTTYDIEFKEPVAYVSDDTYAVSAKARPGDVVVTLADTADLGFVGKAVAQVSGVDVAISMSAGIIRLDPAEMDAKFLAYYMDTHKFWMQKDRCKVGTSIIGIRVPLWQKIKVPVPDMARQREIVTILDRFRELERELELRRKQYGYYRDMLLNFSEKKGA